MFGAGQIVCSQMHESRHTLRGVNPINTPMLTCAQTASALRERCVAAEARCTHLQRQLDTLCSVEAGLPAPSPSKASARIVLVGMPARLQTGIMRRNLLAVFFEGPPPATKDCTPSGKHLHHFVALTGDPRVLDVQLEAERNKKELVSVREQLNKKAAKVGSAPESH